MKNIPQPPCPECEKLAAASEESNKIGAFLEWMGDDKNLILCEWSDEDESYLPSRYRGVSGINALLAEYYGVDLDKVEKERSALLKWLREVQS
jgi:hypothetical protein